jgi:hypothetical protein
MTIFDHNNTPGYFDHRGNGRPLNETQLCEKKLAARDAEAGLVPGIEEIHFTTAKNGERPEHGDTNDI